VKWTAEKLVAQVKTVSSLPTVYLRLNEAVNDPHGSNRDIAHVLSEDPGLTARLLHIVNSAFYGFPSKIDTITRAVTVIGTKQLRDLALATSVIEMFDGMADDVVSMESFWQHSIACGVTARILATYRRENNVERFFVAGLLHDIGRLIMFMKIPELCQQALQESETSNTLLYEAEYKILGFDHANVGGLLLRQWQLPESTTNAVAYHHKPCHPRLDGAHHFDASLIHVADIIANSMQLGSSGERYVPPLNQDAWQKLGLPESILSPTIKQLEHQYMDAMHIVQAIAA